MRPDSVPLQPRLLNQQRPSPRLRFIKRVLCFALFHYIVALGLAGLIFLASHLPPKAIHLDPLMEVLVVAENVLLIPRKLLLWLWPWETTPAALGSVLTLVTSLVWGLALNAAIAVWKKAIT